MCVRDIEPILSFSVPFFVCFSYEPSQVCSHSCWVGTDKFKIWNLQSMLAAWKIRHSKFQLLECLLLWEKFSLSRPPTDWMNMHAKLLQSCPALCHSMDCGPASVHGILQARILEWVAIPFYRGSSQPRNQTRVLHW